ncbi:MAG: YdeI/OmpD-associated family protein [Chitinophagaceae bacterium]|nr:YdeI/OmpD-associated family protein [Chitinophagaceae bacterium]
MAQSLAQKLRISPKMKLLTLHAPSGFSDTLDPLPAGVQVSTQTREYTQIHWFVKDKVQMEKELQKVLGLLKPDVICWIYYPKGSSGIQTDLTRDKGWDALLEHKHLQWISLISFDETWSAFGMRLQTETDRKKAEARSSSNDRPILDYIDPATRTVRVPEDLEKALKRNKTAREVYESLAYSHRKEYVEWIVTAKREETRTERVKGTIERLQKGWKNPKNL